MKNKLKLGGIIAASYCVVGCASIVNGQNQPVSVQTVPVKGATCTLENNKGKWYVPATPATVVVHKSFKDLNVKCEKKGLPVTEKKIVSKATPMVAGNILFGGLIGVGVDVADGAAFDYPNDIQVNMKA
jgi:hypothetical protein